MNNIIIPIVDKSMITFAEEAKKRDDFVVIGIVKSLEKELKKTRKQNVVIKVFEDGSKKEEIINSLRDELVEGKVLICRKEITPQEIEKFFNSNADIMTVKQKRNKFQEFIFGIWQTFVRMLFGFEFFNGDVSVICFNSNLFPVIKNISNLSYSSRINKWKKVEIHEIETISPPAKKEYDKVKTNAMLYGWIFVFLSVVASAFVYFYFVKATFLTGFLYFCAILIAFVMMFIAVAIYYLNIRCGQRAFGKAKTVK